MKIVIADDSSVTRKIIIKMLRASGINNEILKADNGKTAMELVEANCKDIGLVLSDCNMPLMSGIEFIGAMAKNPQTANIPILIISSDGAVENIKQAYIVNSNVMGYLIKPVTPSQLKEKIGALLD
ncbi:MAG: response regulator [Candidatus Omnitrophica bacterium]|nr:response regulator [Candidatus Omnitrophota bacterium]